VGDARPLGIALLGLATFHQGRGEVERARILATRLLTAAEQRGDTEMALLAHSTVANPEYFQGKFASALAHCEAVRTLYEPKRHHSLASVVTIDPGVDALCTGAWALWTLGWPDRALERVCEAVALAKQLSDLNSLAQVLCYEAAVHWLRQNAKEQDERAGAAITLSEAQGFPLFLGLGKALRASARAANGESGAVADMLTGVTLMAETGSQNGAPALFVMLTEAYSATDQLDAARGAVETGLAVSAQGGQAFFDAELLRLQGEILLATGGAPTDAEALFNRALEIARAQEAKSFELRAATSLVRLWRDQDKHANARDLLAPVYAWFTEGFDTGDLKDAKALLDELAT
jgi:tetratricopeptide (TPR) repeat protein